MQVVHLHACGQFSHIHKIKMNFKRRENRGRSSMISWMQRTILSSGEYLCPRKKIHFQNSKLESVETLVDIVLALKAWEPWAPWKSWSSSSSCNFHTHMPPKMINLNCSFLICHEIILSFLGCQNIKNNHKIPSLPENLWLSWNREKIKTLLPFATIFYLGVLKHHAK